MSKDYKHTEVPARIGIFDAEGHLLSQRDVTIGLPTEIPMTPMVSGVGHLADLVLLGGGFQARVLLPPGMDLKKNESFKMGIVWGQQPKETKTSLIDASKFPKH